MKQEDNTNDTVFQSIDEYILSFPPNIQELMHQYRSIIQEELPEATQRMSWQMPTFYLHGNVIHFAGNKKHMGIYPGPDAVAAFAAELKEYHTSKGTIQIPYDRPIPIDLIKRIARFSAEDNIKVKQEKENAMQAKKSKHTT